MAKKPKTEAQRAARREKRAKKKAAAARKGAEIIAAARHGGYQSGPKLVKFTGVGKYAKQAKVGGKGGFFSDLWGQGKKALAGVANWALGRGSDMVKQYLGDGAYITGAMPSENGYVAGAMPKMVGVGGEQPFVVEHHQMMLELKATDVFKVTSVHIQPGLNDFTNWLAPIANQFQQYEIEAMMFFYVPTLSPFSDAASGDLVCCVDYDTAAIPQSTIADAANQYMAVACRPMDKFAAPVECAARETANRVKKTRPAETPDGNNETDQFYDHGIVRFYQEGQPTAAAGQTIGRVYVCYKIHFFKPKNEQLALQTPTAKYKTVANLTNTTPLGAAAANFEAAVGNSLPLTWIDAITFALPSYVDRGKWLLVCNIVQSSATVQAPTWVTSNISGLNIWATSAGYDNTPLGRSAPTFTGTQSVSVYTFTVNAAAPTFQVSGMSATTLTGFEVLVIPLDIDLVGYNWRRNLFIQGEERRMQLRRQNYLESKLWHDEDEKKITALEEKLDRLSRWANHYCPPPPSRVAFDLDEVKERERAESVYPLPAPMSSYSEGREVRAKWQERIDNVADVMAIKLRLTMEQQSAVRGDMYMSFIKNPNQSDEELEAVANACFLRLYGPQEVPNEQLRSRSQPPAAR